MLSVEEKKNLHKDHQARPGACRSSREDQVIPFDDLRNSLERSSARENRVAVGAVAKTDF